MVLWLWGACVYTEVPHSSGSWPHRPVFLSTQHHIHVVKLKPECAAVCFPLCGERPQRQIFNESREAGIFHLSVNLKQNQVNWHNSLSEAVMERRVVAAPVTLGCVSVCISSQSSTSPCYVSSWIITEAIRVLCCTAWEEGRRSLGWGNKQ